MATIQDVARAARVSTATVSRVFGDPDRVSEATRRRVLEAADGLGYVPNFAARSLRLSNSKKILVTVPDISNPFFSAIIRGAEDAARSEGYAVVLGDTRDEPEREEQYAAMLQRREVDGLIFLGHRLPTAAKDVLKKKGAAAPIVNGCEYSPKLPVNSVHIDNKAAAAMAAAHLYALGHERLAAVTGPMASPLSRDRLAGVRAAARARGLDDRLAVREGDFSVESGARETRALLQSDAPPTAIFCFSDEMAIGALSVLRALGLACPADVSVVGFDDIRFARYADPPLTTVAQPMAEIGYETVRVLIDIISGKAEKPRRITLPHDLVVRESAGPPPADAEKTRG